MEREPQHSGQRPARNRWRELLRADRVIVGELELASVLRRVVEAACALVDAPFGALGVVRPDGGGLEEFVHVGMAADLVEQIGHLPEGKGLLGALIEDPRPIRLSDIAADIRSVGFPPHHPPMRGFLGVPIRIRDEVFGHLYLASLEEGDFSQEDEDLVAALAITAGVAIENARLYAESERRQAWLAASTDVTRRLITAPGSDTLRLVAHHVARLSDADFVAIISPHGPMLAITVALGTGADRAEGLTYPAADTLSELVLRTGEPRVVDDAASLVDETTTVAVSRFLPLGPVMALPLSGEDGVRGVLMVGRTSGRRTFGDAEVEMATTFAHHAAVALELATVRRQAQQLELAEDRGRIARDLHDHVIQQLFAAGMALQGAAATAGGAAAVELIETVVDSIDDAIKQIRASIFQLRPRSSLGGGLRTAVLDVVEDLSRMLGHDPHVRFVGPVDTVGRPDLAEEVVAVMRESLANVVKHAHATRTEIVVGVTGRTLAVTVTDDGIGIGGSGRRSGLENLRQRAELRGGTLQFTPGTGGRGTVVLWQVPTS